MIGINIILKKTNKSKIRYLNISIDPSFQRENRLFVLSF